jgi:hypothetical protein
VLSRTGVRVCPWLRSERGEGQDGDQDEQDHQGDAWAGHAPASLGLTSGVEVVGSPLTPLRMP